MTNEYARLCHGNAAGAVDFPALAVVQCDVARLRVPRTRRMVRVAFGNGPARPRSQECCPNRISISRPVFSTARRSKYGATAARLRALLVGHSQSPPISQSHTHHLYLAHFLLLHLGHLGGPHLAARAVHSFRHPSFYFVPAARPFVRSFLLNYDNGSSSTGFHSLATARLILRASLKCYDIAASRRSI